MKHHPTNKKRKFYDMSKGIQNKFSKEQDIQKGDSFVVLEIKLIFLFLINEE
jgi:hypothetical protein